MLILMVREVQGKAMLFSVARVEFTSSFDLSTLDGTNGFVISGTDAYDYLGTSTRNAGDVNGDGFDDLIIGAYRAYPNNNINARVGYVVFGSSSEFASNLDLSTLDGTNGFKLNVINVGDIDVGNLVESISVNSAGDVNGDGFDDLIIGTTGLDRYDLLMRVLLVILLWDSVPMSYSGQLKVLTRS